MSDEIHPVELPKQVALAVAELAANGATIAFVSEMRETAVNGDPRQRVMAPVVHLLVVESGVYPNMHFVVTEKLDRDSHTCRMTALVRAAEKLRGFLKECGPPAYRQP